MPVILNQKDYATWLDPAELPAEQLLPLLRPYPVDEMTAHRVSRAANSPKCDEPGNIEALPDVGESLFE
jgi:putative SOS response-associated peptidase YedK